jgi:transposase
MKKRSTLRLIEVNLEELDRIIDHGTRAPLSESDRQKIKTALHTLADRLAPNRSTEKTSVVLEKHTPETSVPAQEGASSPAGHGRHGAADFAGATRVSIPHATLHAGDACPECGPGKVYRQKEPATLLRIVGQAPLKTTLFEMEGLRCNACGQIFTAVAPETAGTEKYDATAVAMIALLKYGTGVPFKRTERLQGQLTMPLPAATQWELMEAAAKLIRPMLQEIIRQGGQGGVLHNDDTSMRILRLTREPGDQRTGIFTSGIISILGVWKIALFFTGAKHAGENIAEVLKQRARELLAPIQMCDALSRNTTKASGVKVLLA